MTSILAILGLVGFPAAAIAFTAMVVLVLVAHPGTRQANWLVGALLVSALWAAASVAAVWWRGLLSSWLPVLDALHIAAWVWLLATMLVGAGQAKLSRSVGQLLFVGSALATGGVVLFGPADGLVPIFGDRGALIGLLALPLLGLFGLEQTFRNSSFASRHVLRPLSIGIGLICIVDVFVYSNALLLGEISVGLWSLRGIVNAVAAPFILLAVKRHPDWEREIFVSRQVVFYTTGLMGGGFYFLAMGIGGSLVGAQGGAWGPWFQLVFLISAAAVFFYGLFSVTVRRRARVFLAKHFYKNRYDYRAEWLRLIDTLAGQRDASLPERGVKALANIIGSRKGEVWAANSPGSELQGHGALGTPVPVNRLSADDDLVKFLRSTHWVVDTREYAVDSEKYANAFSVDAWYFEFPAIFVPLIHEDRLSGIVRLERPDDLGELSYEDHDLLKTAGKQVAIFLAQELAQEELSESRQFEAFSKLTTFLMHDLKNLIAQQELVVGNAQRFKHRPEFIDDSIRTIESSVRRMRKLLERLGSVAAQDTASRVNLAQVLGEVSTACADRDPVPRMTDQDANLVVSMDRDKFNMAITHAVRNAQDATASDGTIEIGLYRREGSAVIEIRDSGVGMDETFIRDRLFKAFDSTKGAQGMGIGAYQIREAVHSVGGVVEVSSSVGGGTCFRIRLPLIDSGTRSNAEPLAS